MAPRRAIGGAPPAEAVSVLSCIDSRYSAHLARAMKVLGYDCSYFDVTAAGASFPLHYPQLAQNCGCTAQHASAVQSIADGVVANLTMSASLTPQKKLFVLDHQDCGAFKAFLRGSCCLNYPATPSASRPAKQAELAIHAASLVSAKAALASLNLFDVVVLGVLDRAGCCAFYDDSLGAWSVAVSAERHDPCALFSDATSPSSPSLTCCAHSPRVPCAKPPAYPATPPLKAASPPSSLSFRVRGTEGFTLSSTEPQC